LKIPAGSKACLRRRCTTASGADRGWNTPAARSPPRKAWHGRRARRRARAPPAHRRAREPALRAAPLHQLAPGQAERRRGLGSDTRHSTSPSEREGGQGLLARRRPQRAAAASSRALAAQPRTGRLHRRLGARQAQVQHAVLPQRGRHRQRLAAPFVDAAQRVGLVELEAQRGLGHRARQHLERHLEHDAERAQAARDQAGDVVAGDVLHDLAAEAQHLAAAVEQLDAEHEVAHRARSPAAARTGRRRRSRHGRVLAPKCGGSKARYWPCSASAASSSASGVPPRTVTTSSVGSCATTPRLARRRARPPSGAAVEILAAAAAQAQRRLRRAAAARTRSAHSFSIVVIVSSSKSFKFATAILAASAFPGRGAAGTAAIATCVAPTEDLTGDRDLRRSYRRPRGCIATCVAPAGSPGRRRGRMPSKAPVGATQVAIPRVQKRGMSGYGTWPLLTFMRPYSAQRLSVGIALPGLSSPGGSKAALTRKNWRTSAVVNCAHIWLIFSSPRRARR
jgi:hypothetical protein